jgi:hypothetical protein
VASPSPGSISNGTDNAQREASVVSLGNVLVSLGLSVLVLAGVGYWTFDPSAVRQMLRHTNAALLGAALLVTIARVVAGGWRLQFVSQGRLSLISGTRGQLAWEFFSSVTPSAIGGGPVTAFYIARERNITVGDATALMLFAMLLDQLWFIVAIPVVVASSTVLDVIPNAIGSVGLWLSMAYFVGMLLWASVFAYATLFRPHLLVRLADWFTQWPYLRRFRSRVLREMRTFTRRARRLRSQPPSFYVKGFLITAATWIGRYVLVLFIVASVHPGVDAPLLLFRTAAMTLVGLAMPTPGGSGGLEGLYALFLGPLMPDALVVPTLLTWRLLGYYLFIAVGAYLFTHQVHRAYRTQHASGDTGSPDAEPPAADASPPVMSDPQE